MKYTIKDLASELNLSRNTVAKVLNGKSGVSPKTTKIIQDKINEWNEAEAPSDSPSSPFIPQSTLLNGSEAKGNILFLTRTSVNRSDFWTTVMKGIENVLKQNGYGLAVSIMDNEDMEKRQFPNIVYSPETKGIILVEICDPGVCNEVLKLRLPTVTLDMPKDYEQFLGRMDIITMENKKHIKALVSELIWKGYTKFAFAGDLNSIHTSRGFQERYDALCEILDDYHLPLLKESCFLKESDQLFLNSAYMIHKVKNLSELPQAYICGNDWTALQLSSALQLLGYRIPEDISIIGFDNINEASKSVPPLTTININKEYLGTAAARCILNRIQHPQTPYVYAQYMTELVLRSSTIPLDQTSS